MTERYGDWCQTFTGRAFWPLDPRPDEVCAEDIAHALALQCRFAGHCRTFYSVAEHSVRVSWIVPKEDALAGLLHDAAEAYLVDLPRPIKRNMPLYQKAEHLIAMAIGAAFEVDLVNLPASVKRADERLLETEKRDIMAPSSLEWAPLPEPLVLRIDPWEWQAAEREFLRRLLELQGIPITDPEAPTLIPPDPKAWEKERDPFAMPVRGDITGTSGSNGLGDPREPAPTLPEVPR